MLFPRTTADGELSSLLVGGLVPLPDDDDDFREPMEELPDRVDVLEEASEDTPEELALKESVDDDFKQIEPEVSEDVKEESVVVAADDNDEEIEDEVNEDVVSFDGGVPALSSSSIDRNNSSSSSSPGTRISSERACLSRTSSSIAFNDSPACPFCPFRGDNGFGRL